MHDAEIIKLQGCISSVPNHCYKIIVATTFREALSSVLLQHLTFSCGANKWYYVYFTQNNMAAKKSEETVNWELSAGARYWIKMELIFWKKINSQMSVLLKELSYFSYLITRYKELNADCPLPHQYKNTEDAVTSTTDVSYCTLILDSCHKFPYCEFDSSFPMQF